MRPEVIETRSTTGDAQMLLKLVARDRAQLYPVTDDVLAVPGANRTGTSVLLAELRPGRTRAGGEAAAHG